MAQAGPHRRCHALPIGILHKDIILDAALIGRIQRVNLDAGVDYQDRAETILSQVADHPRRIGEAGFVPREDAISVHVIDVEINDVRRDLVLSKSFRDLAHAFFRIVRPSRLLVPQGPDRRQGHAACETRVVFEDLFGRAFAAAGEDEIIELTAAGTE